MIPMGNAISAERHDLIRWYAMKADGSEVEKRYTYHNFVGGWYLELDSSWASRLTVQQQGDAYEFHLWNETFTETEKVLTITVVSGQNRADQGEETNRFVVYTTESTTFWATLSDNARNYGITQDAIIKRFHLIQRDWKTGET
jgi:hypothetical protein